MEEVLQHRVNVVLITAVVLFLINRICHFVSSCFSVTYKNANYNSRAEWNLRWVAMLNGTITSGTAIYVLLNPAIQADKLYAPNVFFSEYFLPFSIGYHLYDSLMNIYYLPKLKKYSTLIHHALVIWVASINFVSENVVIFYHGLSYLMSFTDVFYHTNYLLLHAKLEHRHSFTYYLLFSLHYFLFFFIRIIICSYYIFYELVTPINGAEFVARLAAPFSQATPLDILIALKDVLLTKEIRIFMLTRVCFSSFQLLNFQEFYTMSLNYFKNISGKGKHHHKKHHHDTKQQDNKKNNKVTKNNTKKQA